MTITVRYFAALRESKGAESEEIEVSGAETVAAIYARLFPEEPRIPVAFAVNQTYVERDHTPGDGDELALLPPVGGG